MEEILTPSENGCDCKYSGANKEYECCCDECEYFLECYPQYDNGE